MMDSEDAVKLKHLAIQATANNRTITPAAIDRLLLLDNETELKPGPISSMHVFPNEIWGLILLEVDIKTLTQLRHTSRGFRNIIDTCYEYRQIYEQASYLIKACLITEIASYISLRRLYAAFVSTSCAVGRCGNGAEYIYLLKAHRLCTVHVRSIKTWIVLGTDMEPWIDKAAPTQDLPRMRDINSFAMDFVYHVDAHTAEVLVRKRRVFVAFRNTAFRSPEGQLERALRVCIKTPYFDSKAVEDVKTYWGYYCKEDYGIGRLSQIQLSIPAMTRDKALKHFETCENAKALWKVLMDEKNGEGDDDKI